ncbi:hypothetical protein [Acidovorax radicis]|uniref:hypothetical protein n=1 Tax=Acidovorax radicis TaxID=758826 RepID=UPI001CFA4D20|nr:hypothetical protein [Acidovorax radicis]UCV01227.1 hypothetical protein KI609_11190 [Acidovorax radicis]
MKTHFSVPLVLALPSALVTILCSATPAFAQAPGEDPVVLNKKLIIQMQPTGNAAPSGNIDGATGMPSWLRARVARYEAKAFSGDTTGIATNSDVVTTANAQGMQKTCVQEVGSNTLSSSSTSNVNRYGPQAAPQVVVLRGDLVNICN